MTLPLVGETKIGGILTDNVLTYAYLASRFTSPPTLNDLPPDSPAWSAPDYGPVTSGGAYGGFGVYEFAVNESATFWIGMYQAGNPTAIAWERKSTVTHTSQQGWTAIVTQATPRSIARTTGSGGTVTLPQATLTVADTTAFLSSGSLLVKSGNHGWVVIDYTGLTGTTFTGCTNAAGDNGSTVTNSSVFLNAYRNGGSRRHVMVNAACVVHDSGDSALLYPVTTLDGSVFGGSTIEAVGIDSWFAPTAFTLKTRVSLHLDVDPNGVYGAYGIASGGASVAVQLNNFREADE